MHVIDTAHGGYAPVTVEPKLTSEQVQKVNRQGVTLWNVNALHTPDGGKPVVISITVPAPTRPNLQPMQPVVWTNLRVDMYKVGDSAGLWFAADAVTPKNAGRE